MAWLHELFVIVIYFKLSVLLFFGLKYLYDKKDGVEGKKERYQNPKSPSQCF